jgi:hypothetical protein
MPSPNRNRKPKEGFGDERNKRHPFLVGFPRSLTAFPRWSCRGLLFHESVTGISRKAVSVCSLFLLAVYLKEPFRNFCCTLFLEE